MLMDNFQREKDSKKLDIIPLIVNLKFFDLFLFEKYPIIPQHVGVFENFLSVVEFYRIYP